MRCRDRWRKLSRKSGDSIAWSNYRNCKREVKRLLRLTQKSYVEQEVKKDPNNSSNMWKIIPTCIPKISNENKITICVIKDCLPVIAPWMTSIINNSFANNIFPTAWKIAEVIPIHKDGDHEQPNYNRPISLLPVLSKICERIALNQLTSYLTIYFVSPHIRAVTKLGTQPKPLSLSNQTEESNSSYSLRYEQSF